MSVGAWEKTADVTFSSGIVGENFGLQKQITGWGSTDNFYTVELGPDGNYRGATSSRRLDMGSEDGKRPDRLRGHSDGWKEANAVKAGQVVGASIRTDGTAASTGVIGGAIKGLFDPVKSTWQAVSQRTVMETATFLNKVNSMTNAQKQAFSDAALIPAFAVGQTDLRGSGSVAGGVINLGNATDASKGVLNATFLAPSTGGNPQIWASANVTGAYSGTVAGGSVGLAGYVPGSSTANGISASFNVQQWTGTKWSAMVTNGNVPAGTPGFTYPNAATTGIQFQGGAAGLINPAARTFSGTAAGVVK